MGITLSHIDIYLPNETLDNVKLADLQNHSVTPNDIFKSTGINRRYIAAENQTAVDMAIEVGESLMAKYQTLTNEVDMLIFCSEGFDYIAPASACIVQDRLKLSKNITAFDLPLGCSGYVYGLGIANAFLHSGMASKVLFITSDIPSKVIAQDNFELRSIFSDIATATIIEKASYNQHFIFGTDGSGFTNLMVDYSGFRNRNENTNKIALPNGEMKMNSTEIFRFAIKEVPKLVNSLLHQNHSQIDDIDLFVFHQASFYLLEIIRRKIKAPKEKFYVNLDTFGNSVSSSIPTALFEAQQKGVLTKGMKVMLVGYGIGYSWGGTIIEY
jgi:3-oxoacyl-[acyl-carrier-protein] synthase-3